MKQSMSLLMAPSQDMVLAVGQNPKFMLLIWRVFNKIDSKNAFNFICSDKMFATVDQLAPKMLAVIQSLYSSSSLFFGKDVIQ